MKGRQGTQVVTTQGDSRVYTWTYSNLQSAPKKEDTGKKETETALGRLPPPDVQLSSFGSWEEVGAWYWNLQKDRAEPSAAIRAKAAELTKGAADDAAKLRAIYNFVSTQYRYIGIAFGIGRYQPHAADDVLTNNYGDCKDKHTLLAALLQASGINLYPALINSSYKIDPDIPSPAQFDHIIGYLPQAKSAVWLDTTPEVAPVGFLIQRLRDKQALVMSGDKSIQLMITPADPPFPTTETFRIDGKLGDDGTLEAKVEQKIQGESEVVFLAVFRQIPQPQWKDLVQELSYRLGFAGTVSNVTADPPGAIGEPFHFSYSYNRKEYPDWSARHFTVPGLPFSLPPITDDSNDPIWLGTPMEVESDSKVEVPNGYKVIMPTNVDLKYDFAEYHASYSSDGASLAAKRRLLMKLHEVPVGKFEDYRKFVKNIQDDVNQYVQTSFSNAPADSNASFSVTPSSIVASLQELPESSLPEASRLEEDAHEKMSVGDLQSAVSSLYRAVSADPKFARAWALLGVLLLKQKQKDAGVDAFHKAIAIDSTRPAIPKAFGLSLMASSYFEDAATVWQDFIKAHPDDVDGPANLGSCLLRGHRNSEAAEAFETATKLGDSAELEARLGAAYLLADKRSMAAAAFSKLAELDREGRYFNDVAYQMANADLQLPTALDYAQKAVERVEKNTQDITLPDLKVEDLRQISRLAAYWDTLGWVHERTSNLEEAEEYLLASWKLTQDAVVGSHLCHHYQRTHKTERAIQFCRMSIFRMSASAQLTSGDRTELSATQQSLKYLTSNLKSKSGGGEGGELVIHERQFKLPRFLPGTESAEFFVLLASNGKGKSFKIDDVKFVSGSEKMKTQEKQLRNIDFKISAPSDIPTRFVRRGILGCYQYTGCSFVLLDPALVLSLN